MPNDKVVQDGCLASEGSGPEVGPGPWYRSAEEDLAKPTQMERDQKVGEGPAAAAAPSFSVLSSPLRCVCSCPVIQLLFNFVFKECYQNRACDGCAVLS